MFFQSAVLSDTKEKEVRKEGSFSDRVQGTGRAVASGGGGQGGKFPPPDFGRSINPISTRGSRLCSPHYYVPSRIFRPCDGPDRDGGRSENLVWRIVMRRAGAAAAIF